MFVIDSPAIPYRRLAEDTWFPGVDVELHKSGMSVSVTAHIDSGADYSVFRGEVADDIGIPLVGDPDFRGTALSGEVRGYLRTCEIALPVGRPFPAEVVFVPNAPRNLLGRHVFFDLYKVGFCQRERSLFLEQE